jgi:hypothetical protein
MHDQNDLPTEVRAVARRSIVRLASAEFTVSSYDVHVRVLRGAWDAGIVPSSRPLGLGSKAPPGLCQSSAAGAKAHSFASPTFPDRRGRFTRARSSFQQAPRGPAGTTLPIAAHRGARWHQLRWPDRWSRRQ